MPADTVTVARPTKWGNPFVMGAQMSREEAMAAYRAWLDASETGQTIKKAARDELRGKNLACWCRLDEACHADVLLDLANAQRSTR